MSLIVIGVSHRTAPVPLLERVAMDADTTAKLLADLRDDAYVDEAMVLSTCNRVEVYLEAPKFHPAVDTVTDLLVRHSGGPVEDVKTHLFVHYEDRAVEHLFSVASGMDSMVVGEAQILGQVREALKAAQVSGAVGRTLNDVVQRALHAGKRAHAETGIDAAGSSLVGVGVGLAAQSMGGLEGRPALVVGAGSMAALATAALHRAGARVVVANRTPESAHRLAATVGGSAAELDDLASEMAGADLVVSCTGAVGYVVTPDAVAAARPDGDARPLYLLDLALPRDVDPAVMGVHGVTLVDLEDLGQLLEGLPHLVDVDEVRRIVAEEVQAYLDGRHHERVAPTVVALRGRAADIVAAELARFDARRPGVDPGLREEFARTLGRVVDKLLHSPTVRIKELAAEPDADAYARALSLLFDLDPRAVEAVGRPDLTGEEL